MVDRVDFPTEPAPSEAPAPSSDRPDWLPPEFNSVDDFTKSYAATKAELTRKSQELAALRKEPEPAPAAAEAPEEEPQPKPEDALKIEDKPQEAPAAPVDFAPYQQEFASTGDVSEDSRAKIADGLKGLFGDNARSVVDDYIETQKVRRQTFQNELLSAAGGQERYTEMVTWAKDSLSQAEKDAFNRQIDSGDFHAAKFAIEGLRAKYEKANGAPPKLVSGDNTFAPGTGGAFTSVQDLRKAIADPRYKTDPTYRKDVERRVALSNL